MVLYLGLIALSGLLFPITKKQHYKLYMLIIAGLLAVLAYHIGFESSSDLYRHFSSIDDMRGRTIQGIIEYTIVHKNPLTQILYAVFSRFPDNRLMVGTVTFVSYILMFDTINCISEDNNLAWQDMFALTLYVLLTFNFYLLVNCIRMWLAFAVFFRCLYEESIRKRHKLFCWIIYLALIFFHYGTLFMILSRIMAMIISNFRSKELNVRNLVLSILGLILLIVLAWYLLGSESVLSQVVQSKYDSYESYATRGTWQTIIGWIRILIAVLPVIFYRHFGGLLDIEKEYVFTILILFFANVWQYKNYVMVLRFGDAFVLAPLAIWGYLLSQKEYPFSLRCLSKYEFLVITCSIVCFGAICFFCYNRYMYFVF